MKHRQNKSRLGTGHKHFNFVTFHFPFAPGPSA